MKNETVRGLVTAASLRPWIVSWLTWAAGLIVVAMSWSSWQPSGAPPYEDMLPTGTLFWLWLAVWSLPGAVLTAAYRWMVLPHVERYFFLVDDFAIAGESGQHTIGRLVSAPLFGFYRPVTDIAARFHYAWFGWELPSGYAAGSLALHIANAIGVRSIASRLRFSAPAQIVSAAHGARRRHVLDRERSPSGQPVARGDASLQGRHRAVRAGAGSRVPTALSDESAVHVRYGAVYVGPVRLSLLLPGA